MDKTDEKATGGNPTGGGEKRILSKLVKKRGKTRGESRQSDLEPEY